MDHAVAPAAEATDAAEPVESVAEHRLITVIGLFKAFKGVMLLGAALGTFALLGRDLEYLMERLTDVLALSPDSRLVRWLYLQADTITDGTLEKIAGVGVVYGLLLCTEGYGLLRRRKWAEELVVVGTLIPVPFELYEIVHDFSLKRVLVLLLNLAIVGYLLKRRRDFTTRKQRKAARAAEHAH